MAKLILGNIFLTLVLFYWVYSELTYLNLLVRENLSFQKIPLSQTSVLINTTFPSVVINPFTGSFLLVNPIIFPLLIVIAIFILILIL
jgi:hypothetical protein